MFEVICISFAFFFGLAVRQIGLPPLVGFLGAGFAINFLGPSLGLPSETGDILDYVAHLGVLMLLFTVGLKLKLRQVVQPQVIGGALLHFAISVALFAPGIHVLTDLDWDTSLLLAIALAFSSTVLAAKLLEKRRELGTFHGRTAIGILIVQDIIALVVLGVWSGQTPNAWALLLLALPIARPVLHWLLDFAGHDELLILMGMLLALVVGGTGFTAMGLSSEIGALLMGALLSNHDRAKELSDSLWSLKEIFLVGFFLQIGMSGLPDLDALWFALIVTALLSIKGVLFFFLMIAFRLRARTSFLSALSLTAYSEFGLIVAAGIMPEWLVPLAIAVALSFFISAPMNRYAHSLFRRLEPRLRQFELETVHPDEQPSDLGDAEVMIFGMGRTGTAAYDYLVQRNVDVIGLDADTYKAAVHQKNGRNVLFGDAEDSNFWRTVDLSRLKGVILALDDTEAKLISAKALRRIGFTGPIIAHSLFEDHAARIKDAGVTHTYLTMYEAGMGLAQHTLHALTPDYNADD